MAHKTFLDGYDQPTNRMMKLDDSRRAKLHPVHCLDWRRPQTLHNLVEGEEDDGYFSVKGSVNSDFSDTNSICSDNSVTMSDRSMDTPLYFKSKPISDTNSICSDNSVPMSDRSMDTPLYFKSKPIRENGTKKVSCKTLLSQIEILVADLKKYPAAAMVLVTAIAVVVYLVFCKFPTTERVLNYYVTVMPPDCSGDAKSSLNVNKVMNYLEAAAHTGTQAKRDTQSSSGDVRSSLEENKVMNNVETEVHTGTQAKRDKWKATLNESPGVITSIIQFILFMLVTILIISLIFSIRI